MKLQFLKFNFFRHRRRRCSQLSALLFDLAYVSTMVSQAKKRDRKQLDETDSDVRDDQYSSSRSDDRRVWWWHIASAHQRRIGSLCSVTDA